MRTRSGAIVAATMLLLVTTQAMPLAGRLPLSCPDAPTLLVHEGHGGAAKATGVVNSIDVTHRTINFSHKAVSAFGWPAMTIDFPVGDDVDLTQVRPGMHVDAILVREGGSARVDTLCAVRAP